MRKLDIGSNRFTEVVAIDEPEFNANHEYGIGQSTGQPDEPAREVATPIREFASIQFQKGPIKENGVNGCHHEDLLVIVLDRLQSFQDSEFSCRENAIAITKIEEALHWLDHGTKDRAMRGVEGTSEK